MTRPWRVTKRGPACAKATAVGLEVAVRLTPRGRADRIDGPVELADGTVVLGVHVTAPPHGGAANAALVKLLARAWGVAKSDISLIAGSKARTKRVLVAGDAEALARRLEGGLKDRNKKRRAST